MRLNDLVDVDDINRFNFMFTARDFMIMAN